MLVVEVMMMVMVVESVMVMVEGVMVMVMTRRGGGRRMMRKGNVWETAIAF